MDKGTKIILVIAVIGALAAGLVLGRVFDGGPDPEFDEVTITDEQLEEKKPDPPSGLIDRILQPEVDPDQVATAPGAGQPSLGGFCGPLIEQALARAEAQRQVDEVPTGDLVDRPVPPPAPPVDPDQEQLETATALLFDAGRYEGSTLELFTVDNAGDASRLLYTGVHRPLEFGVRDNGVAWVSGSRFWYVKPAIKGGSLAGAGAGVGAVICGSQCAVGGAVIGGVAGAIWGAN